MGKRYVLLYWVVHERIHVEVYCDRYLIVAMIHGHSLRQ
jgi:hypothetical protein